MNTTTKAEPAISEFLLMLSATALRITCSVVMILACFKWHEVCDVKMALLFYVVGCYLAEWMKSKSGVV